MQTGCYATVIQRPASRLTVSVDPAWHVNASGIFVRLAVVKGDGSVTLRTNIVLGIWSLAKLEFLLRKNEKKLLKFRCIFREKK